MITEKMNSEELVRLDSINPKINFRLASDWRVCCIKSSAMTEGDNPQAGFILTYPDDVNVIAGFYPNDTLVIPLQNIDKASNFGDNIKFGDGSTFTPGPELNMEQGIMLPEDENGNRKLIWEDRAEYEKQKKSSELAKSTIQQEDYIGRSEVLSADELVVKEFADKAPYTNNLRNAGTIYNYAKKMANVVSKVNTPVPLVSVIDKSVVNSEELSKVAKYIKNKIFPMTIEEAEKLAECESIVYDIAKKKIMEKMEKDKTIELLKEILSDIKTVCENSIITIKHPYALYDKTHYMEYVIDKIQGLIDINTDI